jgi:hypothetical protein
LAPAKPAQDEAARFLIELLSEGPIAVGVVSQGAAALGISEPTLERAKKSLRVRSRKTGMDGGWEWSLPEDPHAPRDEGLRSRGAESPPESGNDSVALDDAAEGDHTPARQQTVIPFAGGGDDE